MKLSAFYFSGTGNTEYLLLRLLKKLSPSFETKSFPVGQTDLSAFIREADLIVFAFPIYGSSPPIPMREFVYKNRALFRGKRAAIMITQYFFSGDGAASLGRTLRKAGAEIVAAEHFNMPNNLSDCKIFPIKNGEEILKTLARAEKRLDRFAQSLLRGGGKKRGFGIFPHAVGYFSQRVFWRKGEKDKRNELRIDPARCVGCGACVKQCPAGNLTVKGRTAFPLGKCVLCYRCVNLCPHKAIALIGSEPPEVQYRGVGKME